MIFSNLVATIRADLDAIKDDLGEFVTTVKTDTTAMLGLRADGSAVGSGAQAAQPSSVAKMIEWEEELYDNPDLLCEDPDADDWLSFVTSNPVKEEEVEALLSGATSDLIPELYRELVPAKTTHSDFFMRLIYHRNRMNQAAKSRVQELALDNNEEEETRWEDDDDEVVVPAASISEENRTKQASPPSEIVQDSSELNATRAEVETLKEELLQVKEELSKSRARVEDLERLLAESEAARKDLEASISLPHKKVASLLEKTPEVERTVASTERAESSAEASAHIEAVSETERTTTPPTTVLTPSVATSWEALPTSPGSSSNEEPVMLVKSGGEDEEDDWE